MTTLLPIDDEPPVCEVGECRRCHRALTDATSLGYSIGPTCRRRLGIAGRRPLRLGGVPRCGHIDGQVDLFDDLETEAADG